LPHAQLWFTYKDIQWNERRAAMEGEPVIPDFGGH